MYSTLAGFVEPGETLEEAVAREVWEESGIQVRDVRYHSSQPWPFPSSLMLGFHAAAKSFEIVRNDDELGDAQWYTAEDLAGFESVGRFLPRRDSIARRLVQDWVAMVRPDLHDAVDRVPSAYPVRTTSGGTWGGRPLRGVLSLLLHPALAERRGRVGAEEADLALGDEEQHDRKSTRMNYSTSCASRMPSSA